jgi:glycosyltransferase involved in cell wall biosynthesis
MMSDLNHQHGDRIVFGCGTRDWRKGPDLFVSTAKKVLQRVPEARFIWIGPEVADDPLVTKHESCAGSRISFVGEKADSKDYMLLGSAFFLSSREDPFPLVALDAADAGLPIVCFANTGGIPEFVGTECGYTVTYEDTDAAADALVSILTDDGLR